MGELSPAQVIVLRHIAEPRVDMLTGRINQIDIRKISEPYRQTAIDLGMHEPPLVDIDGDFLFISPAGRAALERETRDEDQRP
jgi:hypothetical protein